MRRIYLPGGGWLLLAALAVPVILQTAKPLAKKIGQGLRDLGDKIVDASSEEPSAPVSEPKTEVKVEEKKPRKPRAKAPTASTATKKPRSRPKKSLG